MARRKTTSQTSLRSTYSSHSHRGCGNLPFYLQRSQRMPLRCVTGNAVLLRSPGSLESMLKTTTETGDIGIFTIKPTVPPASPSDCYPSPRTREDSSDAHLLQASRAKYRLDSCHDDRDRLPSSCRETTSDIVSLYGSGSFRSGKTSPINEADRRTYSMPTHSPWRMPPQRSAVTMQRNETVHSGPRPRSPFHYPAQTRWPNVWCDAPSLTDTGPTDRSRHLDSSRSYQRPTNSHCERPAPPASRLWDRATSSPAARQSLGNLHIATSSTLRSRTSIFGQARPRMTSRTGHVYSGPNTRTCRSNSTVETEHHPSAVEPTAPTRQCMEPVGYDYSEAFKESSPADVELDAFSGPKLQRLHSLRQSMILGTGEQDGYVARLSGRTPVVCNVEDISTDDHVRSGGTSPSLMYTEVTQGFPNSLEEAAASVDSVIAFIQTPEKPLTSALCAAEDFKGPLVSKEQYKVARHNAVVTDEEMEPAQHEMDVEGTTTPLNRYAVSGRPPRSMNEARFLLNLGFKPFVTFPKGDEYLDGSRIVEYDVHPSNSQVGLESMFHGASREPEDRMNTLYKRHRRKNAAIHINTSKIECDIVTEPPKAEPQVWGPQPQSEPPAYALQSGDGIHDLLKALKSLPAESQQAGSENLSGLRGRAEAISEAPDKGLCLTAGTKAKLRLRGKAMHSTSADCLDEFEAVEHSSRGESDSQPHMKFRVKVSQCHRHASDYSDRDGTVVRSPALEQRKSLVGLEYCAKKDMFTSHCRLGKATDDGSNGSSRADPTEKNRNFAGLSVVRALEHSMETDQDASLSASGKPTAKQHQQVHAPDSLPGSRSPHGLKSKFSFLRLRAGAAPASQDARRSAESKRPLRTSEENSTTLISAPVNPVHVPSSCNSRQKLRWMTRWAKKPVRLWSGKVGASKS